MNPQISYPAISLNNQSYFRTNENILNACYQNGFQTFCHPPRSISNTDNNPICETSMFLNSQPYKCKIFITFSEYPFLTPLKFYHGWLYSTIFPQKIFLSCLKNSKTLITVQGIGILQTTSGCNLDSSTPYYHIQNHLNVNNSIPVSKSTTFLAIISPFLYNILTWNFKIYLQYNTIKIHPPIKLIWSKEVNLKKILSTVRFPLFSYYSIIIIIKNFLLYKHFIYN